MAKCSGKPPVTDVTPISRRSELRLGRTAQSLLTSKMPHPGSKAGVSHSKVSHLSLMPHFLPNTFLVLGFPFFKLRTSNLGIITLLNFQVSCLMTKSKEGPTVGSPERFPGSDYSQFKSHWCQRASLLILHKFKVNDLIVETLFF